MTVRSIRRRVALPIGRSTEGGLTVMNVSTVELAAAQQAQTEQQHGCDNGNRATAGSRCGAIHGLRGRRGTGAKVWSVHSFRVDL